MGLLQDKAPKGMRATTAPVSFFDPEQYGSGTNPNLPGFAGIPRIPGESQQAYQRRLMEAQAPYQQANLERQQIEKLAGTQEAQSRKTLAEQEGIQRTRLDELTKLLAGQEDRHFNTAIPELANTAQNQGFLETSGFGQALSNARVGYAADTDAELKKQALADRQLSIDAIGNIGKNNNDLSTSGLQRQFSVTDNAKSEALARELGKMGIVAPSKASKPSDLQTGLAVAGPILQGYAATKTAGAA